MSKRKISKTPVVIWGAGLLLFTHCQSPSAMTELSPQAVTSAQADSKEKTTPVTSPVTSPVKTLIIPDAAPSQAPPQEPDSPLAKYIIAYRQAAQTSLQNQSQAAISTTKTGGFVGIIGGGASAPAPFAMGPAPSSPEGASVEDADLPDSPSQSPTDFGQSPQFKTLVTLYQSLLKGGLRTVIQLESLIPPSEVKDEHEIILYTEKLQVEYLKLVIPLMDTISRGMTPDPQAIKSIQTLMEYFPQQIKEKQKAQGQLALLFYKEAFDVSRAAQSLTTAPLSETAYIKALPAEDILMDSPAFSEWVSLKIPDLPEPEYPQVGSSELVNLRAKYETEKQTLLSLNPPDAWKDYHIWRFVTAKLSIDLLDALETYLKSPGDSPDFLNYLLTQPDLLLLSSEQAALKDAHALPKPTAR
jgi:hypothetical protein